MRRSLPVVVCGVLFGLGSTVPVQADTIVIGACPGCFGLTYTLSVDPVSGSLYTASLNIAGTFSGNHNAAYISAVSFKVTDSVIPPIALTAAPGGVAGWTTSQNNIQNAGCYGSGAGYVCSQDLPTVSLAPLASIPIDGYTWTWTFTLPEGGAIFAGLAGAHIGAKFNSADGTLNGQILSEDYHVPVPEPATLVLVGAGLVGAAFGIRRMR